MGNEKRLIDANNAIAHYKALANIAWNAKAAPVSWADAFEEFVEYLEQAPTIDAARVVHSFWSNDDEDGYSNYDLHCDNCGKSAGYRCGYPIRSNYCPNCGAIMDENKKGGNN